MNILFYRYLLPLNDTVAYRSEWCQGKANQQGWLVPLHLWVSPYSKFGNCSGTFIKTDCSSGNFQAPYQARQSKNCSKKEFPGKVHQSAFENNQLWLKAVTMKEKYFSQKHLPWALLRLPIRTAEGQNELRPGSLLVWNHFEKTSQIKVTFPQSQLQK